VSTRREAEILKRTRTKYAREFEDLFYAEGGGGACKKGETAAKTGCTPASGGGTKEGGKFGSGGGGAAEPIVPVDDDGDFDSFAAEDALDNGSAVRVEDYIIHPPTIPPGGIVLRVVQDPGAALLPGEHTGAALSDITSYLSGWIYQPSVMAYPAPKREDILTVGDSLDDLAAEIDGKGGRSADEWLARFDEFEIGGPHFHAQDPEIGAAVRELGYSWISLDENSGHTLGYVGTEEIPGQRVADYAGEGGPGDYDEFVETLANSWDVIPGDAR
jgi:hypothetical protein